MKWIQASERLPGISRYHVVRYNHGHSVTMIYTDSNKWLQRFSEWTGIPVDQIEWLDESEEQSGDAVAFAEWIEDFGYIRIQSGKRKGLWFHKEDTEFYDMTTSELYNIYKNTAP